MVYDCVCLGNVSVYKSFSHVIVFPLTLYKIHMLRVIIPAISQCVVVCVYMQTLDGIGCSDNSLSLHAVHNLGISWSHLLPVGQVLHYVSNSATKHNIVWDGVRVYGRVGEGHFGGGFPTLDAEYKAFMLSFSSLYHKCIIANSPISTPVLVHMSSL